MVSSGIDSFKIKGRMKTALYVATVQERTDLPLMSLKDPELYKSRMPVFYNSDIKIAVQAVYNSFLENLNENTQNL